jgi:hypothetical protein
MQVTRITDYGGDQCGIEGLDDNGNVIVCMNWTSATWNFYPPEAYDPETGNRWDPNAPGRQMTETEMLTWAAALLTERGAPPHGPTAVLYQAP